MKRTLIFSLATAATIVGLQSCSQKTETPEDTSDLTVEAFSSPVKEDARYDTVVEVNGQHLSCVDISRLFPTDSDYVFLSIRVCALAGSSPVNEKLTRIVDEQYCGVTGGSLFRDDCLTPDQTAEVIDEIGKSFTDTVVPELDDAIAYGFNITIDLRPVFATAELVTYAVYSDYYTGGAHPDYDFYYVTYNRLTGEELGFDQLVPKERREEVRSRLLNVMAKDNDQDVPAYLQNLTNWVDPESDETLTAADFPIYHVGLTDRGLAFAYPKYSIAPGACGCPVYYLPLQK